MLCRFVMHYFVSILLLSYKCIVTINVLWLFLTMPWVGLQSVIVVFPDHTHLLFNNLTKKIHKWYINGTLVVTL